MEILVADIIQQHVKFIGQAGCLVRPLFVADDSGRPPPAHVVFATDRLNLSIRHVGNDILAQQGR